MNGLILILWKNDPNQKLLKLKLVFNWKKHPNHPKKFQLRHRTNSFKNGYATDEESWKSHFHIDIITEWLLNARNNIPENKKQNLEKVSFTSFVHCCWFKWIYIFVTQCYWKYCMKLFNNSKRFDFHKSFSFVFYLFLASITKKFFNMQIYFFICFIFFVPRFKILSRKIKSFLKEKHREFYLYTSLHLTCLHLGKGVVCCELMVSVFLLSSLLLP